jgi:hypothetical protein
MEAILALATVAATGWVLAGLLVVEVRDLRDELKAEREAHNFSRLRDWEEVCAPRASYPVLRSPGPLGGR